MRVCFNYKNKEICLNAKKCGFFGRFRGLMFRRLKNADALLFDFGKPVNYSIHSFFVEFPFVGVWIDEDNECIMIKKINSKILNLKPKKRFNQLIEIPLKKEYSSILELLDDNQKDLKTSQSIVR